MTTTSKRTSDYPEGETSTAQWWATQDQPVTASLDDQLHAAELRLRNAQREGFEQTEIDARAAVVAELEVQVKTAEQARVAGVHDRIRAEWTPELIAERRAAWNALVRSGQIKTPADAYNQGKRQGWTADELKLAMRLYGIK